MVEGSCSELRQVEDGLDGDEERVVSRFRGGIWYLKPAADYHCRRRAEVREGAR